MSSFLEEQFSLYHHKDGNVNLLKDKRVINAVLLGSAGRWQKPALKIFCQASERVSLKLTESFLSDRKQFKYQNLVAFAVSCSLRDIILVHATQLRLEPDHV